MPESGRAPDDRAQQAVPGCPEELWTLEIDRLFTAALNELRRRAEQTIAAAEKRRIAEVTELSRGIKKQHEIIEALKTKLLQTKQEEALRVSEAKKQWQQAEAERMNAARQTWEAEKEELAREANRHRSVAEQLADHMAALKAKGESKEHQFWERLREITADVDRCLVRARADWEREIARITTTDWKLPSFLTKPGSLADEK